MKKRVIPIAFALTAIILFLGICTLSKSTEVSSINNYISPNISDNLEMLVFISPQYAEDYEISTAIKSYLNAVKTDISWNTKIISLTKEQNDYKEIDFIIEKHYENYNIKACIMVGEDIDTALGGSNSYMKKPSTIPWETIGREDAYEISKNGIVCKPYKIDICVSLLYPTSDLDFTTKKIQIIDSFNKFSSERISSLNKEIHVFESSDINENSKDIYIGLESFGKLYYKQDPTDLEIKESLKAQYSMYFLHGHSNPSGTDISAGTDGWFSADYVDELNTPLFGADGCYVGGWWTNQPNKNTLTPSVSSTWYGSKIFTSKYVKVMVLGLLSQNGLSIPVGFIENSLPDLSIGKTVAESIIGNYCLGDTIIIGDPTFHYDM